MNEHTTKQWQFAFLGLCIAAGMLGGTLILAQGLIKVKTFSEQVITVTGSAKKEVVSDYTVWRSEFSRQEKELTTAFTLLQQDLDKVRTYLLSHDVAEEEIYTDSVETQILYKQQSKGTSNEIEGYKLRQTVELRSNDVKKIEALSRNSTALIQQGILFVAHTPRYFYTQLASAKVELLAKATAEAKLRAEAMLQASNGDIGALRHARMGVFQITPLNSTEVSDYGMNDTSSLEKNIMSVVHATFAVNP